MLGEDIHTRQPQGRGDGNKDNGAKKTLNGSAGVSCATAVYLDGVLPFEIRQIYDEVRSPAYGDFAPLLFCSLSRIRFDVSSAILYRTTLASPASRRSPPAREICREGVQPSIVVSEKQN